jgi:hypothetical protein
MNSWGFGWTPFWLMLFLGAYHGVNPGMGWLFAVALGMQEKDGRAVGKSLVPIAIGHMFAIGVVVLAAVLLGTALPSAGMRYPVAAVLVGLGIYRFVRHRHPRWVRMQVGFRDLIVWSFLMASAHGAGLMVLPVLLGSRPSLEAATDAPGHTHLSTRVRPALWGLLATSVHTVGYLAVTGAVAWVVYWKLGLALLRSAWLNLDVVWATALVITGVATLVM